MVERRKLIAMMVAAATLTACAAVPAEAPVDRAALLAQLMALETGSWQHVKDRDVRGMQAFLADDAILIMGDGERFTKAEYVKGLPAYTLNDFAIRPNPELLMFAPDVAAVLYKVTYTSTPPGGRANTMTVLATSTFARRDGRWVSVHYQETVAK